MNRMIKLTPALKDYIWGGNRMRSRFGFESDAERISEAWIASAHPDGPSVIAGEEGTLSDLIAQEPESILGENCPAGEGFPILVKFIDAMDNLSIQVHPNEDYAQRVEGEHGKNEMWYVLDAEPGAGLYVGFQQEVSPDEVRRRIEDGSITDVLNFVETKPGDSFYIPAGTVHAIGAGNLICEVQQSSNCTYRLYDFKRKDKFGNERELHVDKALDVMKLEPYEPHVPENPADGPLTRIVQCPYFSVSVGEVTDSVSLPLSEESFLCVICLEGEGEFSVGSETISVRTGDSVFLPAGSGSLEVSGRMKLMASHC